MDHENLLETRARIGGVLLAQPDPAKGMEMISMIIADSYRKTASVQTDGGNERYWCREADKFEPNKMTIIV